ncbi:hypothetical protein JW926_02990, partial [Candidatus Sumerlaeota bacterium]|nr:hypothetical protein [Candidatus Sumerlaeota bacterium]
VSYFVWGTKRGEGGTPEKPFLIDNFTSSSLDKNDVAILEQKIGKQYFENLFIDVFYCPKSTKSHELNDFADRARKQNMEIVVSSGITKPFSPMDTTDFKTDTLWNPMITDRIHEVFGGKTINLAGLHQDALEFSRVAMKKGFIPVISLNLPGKRRLLSLITGNSQDNKEANIGYPLNYQYHTMALGYLMTFSGIPIILYGDEIGLEKEGLEQLNQDLTREQKELMKRVSRIIKMRSEHLALSRGETVNLVMEKEQVIYLKTYFNSQILCAFNISNEESHITVSLPRFLSQVKTVNPLLKSGECGIERRKLEIKLPPSSFEYYSLELTFDKN